MKSLRRFSPVCAGFLTYYGNLLAGVLHPLQMSLSVLHAKRTSEQANKCRELLSFWAVYNVALAILKWCLGGTHNNDNNKALVITSFRFTHLRALGRYSLNVVLGRGTLLSGQLFSITH
jgi:hypothetical protein